jgi:hypothetical protein
MKQVLQNEKGLATIETLPLLVIFLIMMGYSFGLYGVLQSAIINSISARAYAFETFRNRTNLIYFRTNSAAGALNYQYNAVGSRLHTVISEAKDPGVLFPVTERPLAMGLASIPDEASTAGDASFHNNTLPGMYAQARYLKGVAPVWLKIGYGMCLNPTCAPTN